MSLAFSLGGERAARVPAVESPPTTVPVQAHSPPSSPRALEIWKDPPHWRIGPGASASSLRSR